MNKSPKPEEMWRQLGLVAGAEIVFDSMIL